MASAGFYDDYNDVDPAFMNVLADPNAMATVNTIDSGTVVNPPTVTPGKIALDRTAPDRMTGTSVSGSPIPKKEPEAGSSNAWGTTYDVDKLSGWMKDQRKSDVNEGMTFASQHFGSGNAQIKEILDTRRSRALGLNGAEIQALRERAGSGINAQMQTGMRAMRSTQGANGIRGGAAAGQALPILARANQARGNAERDIAIEDMKRRSQELNNYESSLTGEREGQLGTAFGWAGLGAADRSAALQYGIGKDQIGAFRDAADMDPNLDGDKPWEAKESFKNWANGGFQPGKDPGIDWFHENVFDKKDIGINDDDIPWHKLHKDTLGRGGE